MRGRSLFTGLIIGFLSMLIGVQVSFGAGFALYEGSARGNALGGGLVGRADDPSALFFNPAGITQVEGIQVQAGATFILPDTDVDTFNSPFGDADTTTSTEDNLWIPPHTYLTYQYSDNLWLGLGVFSAFGLGTEFPEDWPGRFNNYNAVIETVTINPNIAFKLNDKLSVAAGLDIMYLDLTLEKKIPVPTQMGLLEFDQSLKGDSFGYGFNVAMHYKACRYASLGISYRSQIKQHVEGDVDFSPNGVFTDTDGEGSITLPDEVFFGLAIYPIERLSLEVGAIWTRWSTFRELSLDVDDPQPPDGDTEFSFEKDWDDVWRLNFSAEYRLLDWLDLRVGYVYDRSPIPDDHVDYLVPANHRHLFGFGPGFRWNNWTLDLSYTYLLIEERDVDGRPGRPDFVLDSEFHDGDTHLIGVTVGYKF